jgi:hypothetical protein
MQKKNELDTDIIESLKKANNNIFYSDTLTSSFIIDEETSGFSCVLKGNIASPKVVCINYSKTLEKISIKLLVNDKVLSGILQNNYRDIELYVDNILIDVYKIINSYKFKFKKQEDNYIITYKWKVE